MKRVALFRGSFNPPHREEVRVVRLLAERFDEVRIVPTGCDGNQISGEVQPHHRAAMADMAFASVPGVVVDLSDLEDGCSRSAEEWERRLPDAEVWHVLASRQLPSAQAGTASGDEHFWSECRRCVVIEEPNAKPRLNLPAARVSDAGSGRESG
ncbi:MAG: hypothetical protein KatS3mg110_4254 [Pirellulaceae bacterium]|nr:MAG: hypothetical protein KatS3mg110_4254 [Pirellulaceae bacterium]